MLKNNTKTVPVSKKTERFRQKKLKSLKKQSVAVAVPVKNTVAASEKARLCVSFGIEAHKLEAVVRTAGGERKIVRFVHRMRGGDIKLVLDILNADVVRLVGLLGFERGQVTPQHEIIALPAACSTLPHTGHTYSLERRILAARLTLMTCSPESSSGTETRSAAASGSRSEMSGKPRPVSLS